jgi:hypothetical protein
VFSEVETAIYSLIASAKNSEDRQVVTKMKALVQEYKSQNSKFEELDSAESQL